MKESIDKEKEEVKSLVFAVRSEVYSRIVGYYRPVEDWNDGKKEEFKERKYLSYGEVFNQKEKNLV